MSRRERARLTDGGAVSSTLPSPTPISLLQWNVEAYRAHVAQLLATHPREEAMELAVGGDWVEIREALIGALLLGGVADADSLVDVGCGSGRLAGALAPYFRGTYTGIDVVQDLLEYARSNVVRDDFSFHLSDGITIPVADTSTQIVCFFSVFTHLPHEAIYNYLAEAHRILRPGGTIVASFLEFADPALWPVFDAMVANLATMNHHNQFTHRDDLTIFCARLGLEIVAFIGATEATIPVPNQLTPTDRYRHFGQSLMILRRPS